jgi:hypothetical protein
MTSLGASENPVEGWAVVETPDSPATTPAVPATPITASVLYRAALDNNRWWDVATVGSGATHFFSSYANGSLGVGLANPNPGITIHLQLSARKEDGTSPGGPWAITIPPRGHTSFNLYGPPVNLPQSFSGSIQISSTDANPAPFVAAALNYRDPVLSPLPPGETLAPSSYERRPYDVGIKARQAGVAMLREMDPYEAGQYTPDQIAVMIAKMGLVVDSDAVIRAYHSAQDNSIHLSTGLVEMLGTNPNTVYLKTFLWYSALTGGPQNGPNPCVLARWKSHYRLH